MENYCPLCNHELPRAKGTFVDNESGYILLDGKFVETTPKIRQVLGLLISKSPRVVSRGLVMDHLYGLECEQDEPNEKLIDVFVCRARRDIKDSNYEIVTEWGRGWIFRQKVLHNGESEQDQRAVG